MSIEQVHPHKIFPSGDRRALLEIRFDPDELTKRYGLQSVDVHDDLARIRSLPSRCPTDRKHGSPPICSVPLTGLPERPISPNSHPGLTHTGRVLLDAIIMEKHHGDAAQFLVEICPVPRKSRDNM